MKYIIVSTDGDKLQGLAQRLELAGDFVSFITSFEYGKPLVSVPKMKNMNTLVSTIDPDAFILDGLSLASKLESYRKYNKPIIGMCEFSDVIQLSSDYKTDVLNSYGIPLAPETDDEVVEIEAWWDDNKLSCFNLAVKQHHFMNCGRIYKDGDLSHVHKLGVEHECSGVVLKRLEQNSNLVKETVAKVEDYLKELTYLGPVRISAVAGSDKQLIGARDISLSFGWDNLPTMCEILPCSISAFFKQLIAGDLPENLDSDYALGTRLTFPPYPIISHWRSKNEVAGLDKGKWKHFWPFQCRDYDTETKTLNSGELFGVATAHGFTVPIARDRVYNNTLASIRAHSLQYRTDVGSVGEGKRILALT